METLGDYLRQRRESQNITLEEVAQATRIRRTILQAIEKNDYDLIPPKVFTQGFIKSYASYLGLDENDVIKRYHEIMESLEAKTDTDELHKHQPSPSLFTPARLLVIGILGVVSLTVWFLLSDRQPSNDPLSLTTPQASSTSSVNTSSLISPEVPLEEEGDHTPYVGDTPLPTDGDALPVGDDSVEETIEATQAAAAEPMTLRIVAKEQVWMRVQLDQGEPYEVTLRSGESLPLEAREKFIMRIGNGGGVELFLNGEALGSPGKSNEVIDLMLPE